MASLSHIDPAKQGTMQAGLRGAVNALAGVTRQAQGPKRKKVLPVPRPKPKPSIAHIDPAKHGTMQAGLRGAVGALAGVTRQAQGPKRKKEPAPRPKPSIAHIDPAKQGTMQAGLRGAVNALNGARRQAQVSTPVSRPAPKRSASSAPARPATPTRTGARTPAKKSGELPAPHKGTLYEKASKAARSGVKLGSFGKAGREALARFKKDHPGQSDAVARANTAYLLGKGSKRYGGPVGAASDHGPTHIARKKKTVTVLPQVPVAGSTPGKKKLPKVTRTPAKRGG